MDNLDPFEWLVPLVHCMSDHDWHIFILFQRALVDSQLSVIQTEKEDLINLLEEESARQDKVAI